MAEEGTDSCRAEDRNKFENFDWRTYLREYNAIAAPEDAFTHSQPPPVNNFNIGMVLLAQDKKSYVFSLAKIIDKKFCWIKVHYEGLDDTHSKWFICNDEGIRALNDPDESLKFDTRGAYPVTGFSGNFPIWIKKQFEKFGQDIAPVDFFNPVNIDTNAKHKFQVGMKLLAYEENNKLFNGTIHPATIIAATDKKITIGFDGWGPDYDIELCPYSRTLFSFEYAEQAGYPIGAPRMIDGVVEQRKLDESSKFIDNSGGILDRNITKKGTKRTTVSPIPGTRKKVNTMSTLNLEPSVPLMFAWKCVPPGELSTDSEDEKVEKIKKSLPKRVSSHVKKENEAGLTNTIHAILKKAHDEILENEKREKEEATPPKMKLTRKLGALEETSSTSSAESYEGESGEDKGFIDEEPLEEVSKKGKTPEKKRKEITPPRPRSRMVGKPPIGRIKVFTKRMKKNPMKIKKAQRHEETPEVSTEENYSEEEPDSQPVSEPELEPLKELESVKGAEITLLEAEKAAVVKEPIPLSKEPISVIKKPILVVDKPIPVAEIKPATKTIKAVRCTSAKVKGAIMNAIQTESGEIIFNTTPLPQEKPVEPTVMIVEQPATPIIIPQRPPPNNNSTYLPVRSIHGIAPVVSQAVERHLPPTFTPTGFQPSGQCVLVQNGDGTWVPTQVYIVQTSPVVPQPPVAVVRAQQTQSTPITLIRDIRPLENRRKQLTPMHLITSRQTRYPVGATPQTYSRLPMGLNRMTAGLPGSSAGLNRPQQNGYFFQQRPQQKDWGPTTTEKNKTDSFRVRWTLDIPLPVSQDIGKRSQQIPVNHYIVCILLDDENGFIKNVDVKAIDVEDKSETNFGLDVFLSNALLHKKIFIAQDKMS